MSSHHRRTIKGMLVSPKSQLTQVSIFVAGALIALLSVSLILFSSINSAVILLVESNRLDSESAQILQSSIRNGFIIMLIFSLFLILYGGWISFRFAHRFFGPTVPIVRLINELKNGQYSSRIQLRSGDELNEVAESLNDLASRLKEASSSSSTDRK